MEMRIKAHETKQNQTWQAHWFRENTGCPFLKRELQGILQSKIPVLRGPFWVLFKQSAVARSGTKEFSTQLAAQNFITVGS